MNWGLVGGGKASQIGGAHRIAAQLDGHWRLAAGALDIDPEKGRAYGTELGIDESRAYGTWQDMLKSESGREDRIDLVTIATPNHTHFEIASAFLSAGFNVLCEKPLTMTVRDAEDLVRVAEKSGKICATNFGYSGYPMAIQAREMVRNGDLGDIRVVFSEFAHGFHADESDNDNPRIRWRYDPEQTGVSSITADCGVHALHMAEFITCQRITEVSAQFDHCVDGRALEDDALLALRFGNGSVGRLWTSAIAIGQVHGFGIRVFGSKGGLSWHQEFPNQLHFTPLNGPTRILERGSEALYPKARAASRIAIGHAEGMFGAFGNIYRSLHETIAGPGPATGDFPTVEDGAAMVRVIDTAARSAKQGGAWTPV
ncbi:Gfo/Idh/MocA family protein [Hoeflea prorocentri]|uniref:Gfo/Idh/MocA family oxidoreductase n=1 Tax=Hoeflea prorocentri TaxID=1922333 RepID=A0A9X3ZFI8_9HYPH|nr:Gfo/Idh/MocA family oxidoreductase [Hoeflea prorocentri]MCY6379737.1 Gfo/Idh/MocA family oxidoreductase [Hoeflea prorocentri]MDA5397537.1 Gfo/Idh/MocA family oxidoreductase [Hoeflea prorocentri]